MRVVLLNRYRSGGIPSSNMLFDYNGAVGVTDAGSGAVSQWNDQSGNGRHLVQATGANRPTTGVATINGINAIRFPTAGSSINLSTGTITSFGPVRTIYMVVKTPGQVGGGVNAYRNLIKSNQVQYLGVGESAASGLQSAMYCYDGTARGTTGVMYDRTACYTVRMDGNNASSSSFRRNGAETFAAWTGATAANNSPTSITLGGTSSDAGKFDVVRIIGYSVKHTDAEAAAIEAQLNALYAFAPATGRLAGLMLPDHWFDFSLTADITSSGGAVSSVVNRGVTGVAATAAGTAQPTTGSATINGRNVLTFDGSSDVLGVNDTMEVRGATGLAVVKTNGFTTNAAIIGPSGNGGFLWRIDTTTGKPSIVKSNVIGIGTATNAVTDATATLLGATYECDGDRWWHRKAKASNGSGTSTSGLTGTNTFQIGRDRATSDYFKGDIGEVAYWKGWMTELEFAAYETALGAQWGL